MSEGRNSWYCRLRHVVTKNEVQVAADYVDGVLTIRHFYAQVKDGLFHEVNRQHCHDNEVFEDMWNDTIKAYQKRGWEVVE